MINYKLKLEIFEGPLDLLLYLIRKNELNICDIPIAQVTEQYMEYLDMMEMLDLEVAGEFLVMAATLMQIKSKMLLPSNVAVEEEEIDPRDELVQRLLEYKKFKEVSEFLKDQEIERQKLFTRKDIERVEEFKRDSTETFFDATLFDLINAFQKVLKRKAENPIYAIEKVKFTVEEKIVDINHILSKRKKIKFVELFSDSVTKIEVVTVFLAILELIKQKQALAKQNGMFGDIEILHSEMITTD
jgi:segregation and condensation protein A